MHRKHWSNLAKEKKACKTQNGEQQEEICFLKIGVDGTEGEEQGGWEKNYLWHKWEMTEERRLKLSRVRLRAHVGVSVQIYKRILTDACWLVKAAC